MRSRSVLRPPWWLLIVLLSLWLVFPFTLLWLIRITTSLYPLPPMIPLAG